MSGATGEGGTTPNGAHDRGERPKLYGLVAEFEDAEPLLEAARAVHGAGYRRVDAYTPFSVEGLSDAIGFPRDRVALFALIGGIVGGVGIYALQWYSAVVDYPFNSGGRPLHSWPAFVVPTFEMTVLGAALAAFVGMLIANGLPRLVHPIFDAPDIDLASRNRFFLCIQAADPQFDRHETGKLLAASKPLRIVEVPDKVIE